MIAPYNYRPTPTTTFKQLKLVWRVFASVFRVIQSTFRHVRRFYSPFPNMGCWNVGGVGGKLNTLNVPIMWYTSFWRSKKTKQIVCLTVFELPQSKIAVSYVHGSQGRLIWLPSLLCSSYKITRGTSFGLSVIIAFK